MSCQKQHDHCETARTDRTLMVNSTMSGVKGRTCVGIVYCILGAFETHWSVCRGARKARLVTIVYS